MANDRVERLLLRVEVAKGELASAKKDLSDLNKELGDSQTRAAKSQSALTNLKREAAAIGRERYIAKLAEDFNKLEPEIRESEQAAKKLAAELEKVGATQSEIRRVAREIDSVGDGASGAGGGNGGGRRTNAITRLGTDIRALPAIPIPNSNLSTDVFGKMLAILGGLNPVAVAVTASVAGLVVGLKIMTAEAQRTTEALIASQKDVITAIKQSTSEEIREKIKVKQLDLEVARARIEENKRILDGLDEQAGPIGRAIADALDVGGAQQLRVETQKLEAEERALTLTTDRLTQALSSQEVAQNNLIAQAQSKQADAERNLAVELQTQLQLTDLTSESIRKRLTSLEAERAATQRLVDSGKLSAKAAEEYEIRLSNIRREMYTLNQGLSGVDAATQRAETIEATRDYNEDIKKIEEERLKAQLSLTEKYNNSIVAIAERAAEAAEASLRKLEEQLGKLELDFGRDAIDADRKAQYEILDAQIEFQREEVKDARAHATELKRIRRRANQDEFDAVAERDVLAYVKAEERKKQELEDANEKYTQEQSERRIAFGQEQQDLRVKFERERQERFIQYQRDLVDAQAQYQRELQLAELKRQQDLLKAQQNYAQDQILLQQKYRNELTLRQQAIGQELLLIQRGYVARAQIQAAAEQALINQSKRLLQAASGVALPGNSASPQYNTRGIQSFDTGGIIQRSGIAMVHRGEIITNPRRGQSPGGVQIAINGTSKAQIFKELDQALTQAGYQ